MSASSPKRPRESNNGVQQSLDRIVMGTIEDLPRTKKAKKSVRIVEEKNEVRQFELLQDAEKRATGNYMDLSPRGVRLASAALQKAVTKNELQRAQYAAEPELYMDSEVSLYENIATFKAIAADPNQLYPVVCDDQDLLQTLCSLLMHENADIATAVISVFVEWFEETEEESAVVALATSLVQTQGMLDLLVSNLSRVESNKTVEDEDDEVGKGPDDILRLIETFLEWDLKDVAKQLCEETKLLSWLFLQVQAQSRVANRCLEVMAILAPHEEVHRALPKWSKLPPFESIFQQRETRNEEAVDGIEILLQLVAAFRKKQPSDEMQVDLLENACIVMAAALTYSTANLEAFMNAQGIELVIRCLKERVHAGGATLKWLDFVGTTPIHRKACERIVEAGGLKYLFPLFLGKNLPKPATFEGKDAKKARKKWNSVIEETIVRIIYCLSRHLKPDSPKEAKQRLLAKFIEEDKVSRIVDLLLLYDDKAQVAEYKFFRSDVEDELEDDDAVQLAALNAKLAAGGDVFHRLGALAAFGCSGSKRFHEQLISKLRENNSGIGLIRAAVEEFASALADTEQKEVLLRYLANVI